MIWGLADLIWGGKMIGLNAKVYSDLCVLIRHKALFQSIFKNQGLS